jgi:hypothetical protein
MPPGRETGTRRIGLNSNNYIKGERKMCERNCNHKVYRADSIRETFDRVLSRGGSFHTEPKPVHPKFLAYCKEEYEKVNNPRYFGSKVLIVYLKDAETNERYGVLISYKDAGGLRFGWSICQTALDKWDKYVGFHYAFKRSTDDICRIPRYIEFEFDDFVERSIRYFKVDPNVTPTNLGALVEGE